MRRAIRELSHEHEASKKLNVFDGHKVFKYIKCGPSWHTPLIPGLGRQRQEDLCEISRPSWSMQQFFLGNYSFIDDQYR